jgi:type IV pilus assembly protein PilE
MKYAKGFTLIEILMVVALIGILAAIAIPSYNGYIIRGKLVDATTQLSDVRIKLEQHFQDNRAYNYADGTVTPPIVSPCPAATKFFTFTCAPTATTYLVTAASKANQGLGAAGDYTYTINESNVKATTKFAGQSSSAACWLMKKGDSC